MLKNTDEDEKVYTVANRIKQRAPDKLAFNDANNTGL